MFKNVFFGLFFFFSLSAQEQVQVIAQDLEMEDHVLKTENGAIVIGDQIRIQARKITYERSLNSPTKIHTIHAKDDLMIVYDGRVFIADEIQYDFIQKKGEAINAITYDNLWFISGQKIQFTSDETVNITDATLTTFENARGEFALKAKELKLKRKNFLSAKHLQVTYVNFPIFYFPYFYTSLSEDDDSKMKYKLTWDSGQGPKFSMRYELFSNEIFDLFFRFDFRTSRGIAGAIETDYESVDHLVDFKTKNYLAHDTFFNDSDPNRKKTRYRLQGILHSKNEEETFRAFVRYDKYSDPNMPLDFDGDDFELNTALKTEAIVQYTHPWVSTNFYLRPKINSFQGFKQELPTIQLGFKPVTIGNSGLILHNDVHLSYLNYQYNQDLEIPISSFHSGRLEIHELLSRPIDAKIFKITPKIGYDGIFYTNSPQSHSLMENLLQYGINIETSFKKKGPSFSHLLTPYVQFYRLHPLSLKDHYIFSYDDGFDPYEYLKIGFKNHFYFSASKWDADLYGYRFFDQTIFSSTFPKIGLDLDCDQETVYFFSKWIYDTEHASFDQANFGFRWTINQYVALKSEFRHRGKYGYRKVNYDDYTLDVQQNPLDLLDSPISSPRNAANLAIQINATRSTQVRYESNIGWARKDQPSYHEFRIDLFKMIATNWKLRISYMHLVNDDQVAIGLNLVPNL